MVYMKYRQPWFDARGQSAAEAHEKFAMRGQAIWAFVYSQRNEPISRGLQGPTHQAADELAKGPPNGQDSQEPLMRIWDEFCHGSRQDRHYS